jgi:hypothetical protein
MAYPTSGTPFASTFLAAAATDDVGVTAVEFHATGGQLNDAKVADAVPSVFGWLGGWSAATANLPDGSYQVVAVARDAAGNVGRSLPITLVVDRTAATSQLIGPATGAIVHGRVLVDAAATDNVRVTKVEFVVTGGPLTNALVATATPTVYGWLGGWDTTTLHNGPYQLQSRAYDAAGNVSLSAPITVTVAN